MKYFLLNLTLPIATLTRQMGSSHVLFQSHVLDSSWVQIEKSVSARLRCQLCGRVLTMSVLTISVLGRAAGAENCPSMLKKLKI